MYYGIYPPALDVRVKSVSPGCPAVACRRNRRLFGFEEPGKEWKKLDYNKAGRLHVVLMSDFGEKTAEQNG